MPLRIVDALTVILIAATPVVELRGAIPFGVGVLGMPLLAVTLLAILGNLLLPLIVYGLGEAWIRWTTARQGLLHRLTEAFLSRSRRRFASKYAAYGMYALPIFVGIPLPMTGALTGSVAAFLLGIPFARAFPLIALGVVIAGAIVASATAGAVTLL